MVHHRTPDVHERSSPGTRGSTRVAVAALVSITFLAGACGTSKPKASTATTSTMAATTTLATTSSSITTSTSTGAPRTTGSLTTSTTASSAVAAFAPVLTGYGAGAQTSGVVATPDGPRAFVAFGTAKSPTMIDVLSFANGAWVRTARLGSSQVTSDQYLEPLIPQSSVATVTTPYLTGSTEPDALVLLLGGSLSDFIDGVVVGEIGGTWQLIPFLDAKGVLGPALEVADPRVSGSSIIEQVNPCVPDCASDHNPDDTTYRFDSTTGRFTPQS